MSKKWKIICEVVILLSQLTCMVLSCFWTAADASWVDGLLPGGWGFCAGISVCNLTDTICDV